METLLRPIFTIVVMWCLCATGYAFTSVPLSSSAGRGSRQRKWTAVDDEKSFEVPIFLMDASSSEPKHTTRRDWGRAVMASATSLWLPFVAGAEETVAPPGPVEMKTFVDPKGLFSINVPKGFYTVRREAKGDLPDDKDGKGRRGTSIFTAGDLGKAEVIAVERFPTRLLLEENGIEPTGDLSTFPGLGESLAVANLINIRREKNRPSGMSNSVIFPESVELSDDKKEIKFKIKSEIEVQKPELLMEQYGIRQLFRITVAKASMRSNDGNLMAVFASALEQDFNGPDGYSLRDSVDSFQPTDQSTAASSS